MTTEDLIRALTADRRIGPKPRMLLLWALVPAIAFAAILFFSRIGFRTDIDAALGTVRFLFKFVIVVPLALVTLGALFRSADPVSTPGWPPRSAASSFRWPIPRKARSIRSATSPPGSNG